MHYLRPIVVAERLADLCRAQALDQPQVTGAILRQTAGDLLADGAVDPDRLPTLEVALDGDDAGRQQALAANSQRPRGPIVGDDPAVPHRLGQHPALAALQAAG